MNGLFEDRTVGSAVEVLFHPQLTGNLELNGWPAGSVEIRCERDKLFEIPTELREADNLDGTQGSELKNDGTKYCLVWHSHHTADNFKTLELVVQPTSYFKLKATFPRVSNEKRRHQFLNIDPSRNQVPHALCLHFICVLKNNDVICMRRQDAEHTDYFPNTLTISFEEQLAEVDFYADEPTATNWFRRAICEEVFPLSGAYQANPREAWARVEAHVLFANYWTIILEEEIGNFSLVGVCKLNMDLSEFVRESNGMATDGRRNDEGRLYVAPKGQLLELLRDGGGCLAPIDFRHDGDQTKAKKERIDGLHPTSAYRLSLLLSCIGVMANAKS